MPDHLVRKSSTRVDAAITKFISGLILLYSYISNLCNEMKNSPLRTNGFFEINESLLRHPCR